MEIASELREALFLHRENRFSCLVELGGKRERAYLRNSGRLKELLLPGRKVFLAEKPSPSRKTRYDLEMVALKGGLVSVDTRATEELVYEAFSHKALPQFEDYSCIQRGKIFNNSRLDFLLSNLQSQCLLEVKSVTLAKEGRAFFPDAPTLRGRKHLKVLLQAKEARYKTAILFIAQREDVESFSPNDEIDPEFGKLLRTCQSQGVAIYAYRCKVSLEEIKLVSELPICL